MISTIITDIEGTTSAISFVHEVLFPYAAENLEAFVLQNKDDENVQIQLQAAANIAQLSSPDSANNIHAIIKQLLQWIADDKKITPLKALQGMVWKVGYENDHFQGHVYEDAYLGLTHWYESNIDLYVYSSGSVAAQKLLFSHTKYGDLSPLFKGNFDTGIGAKKETEAYQNILKQLKVPAQEVLFLSDVVEELDAAKAAGMLTCWLIRDDALPDTNTHPAVDSFKDIILENFK